MKINSHWLHTHLDTYRLVHSAKVAYVQVAMNSAANILLTSLQKCVVRQSRHKAALLISSTLTRTSVSSLPSESSTVRLHRGCGQNLIGSLSARLSKF